MELACGGELFEDLVVRNAFSESTAREVMLQLFSAVQYIHGLRIVHRVSSYSFVSMVSDQEMSKGNFRRREHVLSLANDCVVKTVED